MSFINDDDSPVFVFTLALVTLVFVVLMYVTGFGGGN